MFIQKRRITAADEEFVDDIQVDEVVDEEAVDVDPEAMDLLFETEDVAELVAEVTGEPVEVVIGDEGEVTFSVGEDEFVVEPEGDEEILEAYRPRNKVKAGCDKKAVKSEKTPDRKRSVKASRKPIKSTKTIRRVPKK